MVTVMPVVTDDLLQNPGIGFIAAKGLMGEPNDIRDNRGKPVQPFKFAPGEKTWNHPDSGVDFCSARWKDIETEEGVFNWAPLEEKLQAAKEAGCVSVVRIAPYALHEEEDIPGWLRAMWPDEPEFPFWRIDPNTTDYAARWANFVRRFAARFDGHPLIYSVDMAIVGAWGEGGGNEFMDADKIEAIVGAYIEGFRKTPLQALLHDKVSVACIRSYREKVGFRVDCLGDMGGFHPGRWSHMEDYYPQNIQNFEMGDAWKQAPVLFEACWHMNDWYLQGWDIDYIVDESLKWHISSYNSKGTTVPNEWQAAVTRWLKRMGYRYELHQCRFNETAAPGETLHFEMLVSNSGVAPSYHNYAPVLKLTGPQTAELPLPVDIRTWLPEEDQLLRFDLPLPGTLPAGRYTVNLGFPVPEYNGKTLQLAIEGRGEDGFYPLGEIEVK